MGFRDTPLLLLLLLLLVVVRAMGVWSLTPVWFRPRGFLLWPEGSTREPTVTLTPTDSRARKDLGTRYGCCCWDAAGANAGLGEENAGEMEGGIGGGGMEEWRNGGIGDEVFDGTAWVAGVGYSVEENRNRSHTFRSMTDVR